ncbi:MAG: Hsp20/alpha crystallin family protein [Chitinophagaceae bacterium]|nr:MAG: Hsp20/alpha crystallin family protein [Chitinophagaceae bacterium]
MKNIMKRENGNAIAFGNVVDQLFHQNLSRFFDDSSWETTGSSTQNPAPVNIRETKDSYELEMAVPGLKKEFFQINTSGGTLTVSYEERAKEHHEDNNGNEQGQAVQTREADTEIRWVRREYQLKSFSRTFNLDESIDTSRINARYENGVLGLSLPKKEEAKVVSRSIEIR